MTFARKFSFAYFKRIFRNLFSVQIFLPIILPIIISFMIWWNPDFFAPDTYVNWGDLLFPLRPFEYLQTSYHTWITGSYAQYWLGYLPLELLVAGLSSLGIPLWVVNRLYLMLPSVMLGWFTYYFYRSLLIGSYSKGAGLVASTFVMLAPIFWGNIKFDFAISGFPLMIGSLIRGLNNRKNWFEYAFLVSLSSIIAATEPTIMYVELLVVILFLTFIFLSNRSLFNLDSIKFILFSIIMSLLMNMYWILPFVYSYTQQNLQATILAAAPDAGIQKILLFKNYVSPIWIMRLIVSPDISPLSKFFNLPFTGIFSFLTPIYVYASLLVSKNRRMYSITAVALILTFFGIAPYYKLSFELYMFLYNHLPGFWIVDNPMKWLTFLRIFYGILVGATIQTLISKTVKSKFNGKLTSVLANIFRVLLLSGLLILLYVNGSYLIIYNSPIHDAAGNGIPNHTPSMKIPSAYYDLEAYLSRYTAGYERILNLPLVPPGYAAYSWWHDFDMPEVISFLSPIPVMGITAHHSEMELNISTSIAKGEMDLAINLMKKLNVRYVIVHKDYYPLPIAGFTPENYTLYLKTISNSSYFTEVMSNEYFSLYRLDYNPQETFLKLSNPSGLKNFEIRKISPTQYEMDVNSSSPFYIILNEQFDTNWIAYVNGQEIKEHMQNEVGLNEWYINQTGNVHISIRFRPQVLADLGILISTASFIVTTGLSIYLFFKRTNVRVLKVRTSDKNEFTKTLVKIN